MKGILETQEATNQSRRCEAESEPMGQCRASGGPCGSDGFLGVVALMAGAQGEGQGRGSTLGEREVGQVRGAVGEGWKNLKAVEMGNFDLSISLFHNCV